MGRQQVAWQGSASDVDDVEAAERADAAGPPHVKALDNELGPASYRGKDWTSLENFLFSAFRHFCFLSCFLQSTVAKSLSYVSAGRFQEA